MTNVSCGSFRRNGSELRGESTTGFQYHYLPIMQFTGAQFSLSEQCSLLTQISVFSLLSSLKVCVFSPLLTQISMYSLLSSLRYSFLSLLKLMYFFYTLYLGGAPKAMGCTGNSQQIAQSEKSWRQIFALIIIRFHRKMFIRFLVA